MINEFEKTVEMNFSAIWVEGCKVVLIRILFFFFLWELIEIHIRIFEKNQKNIIEFNIYTPTKAE